MRWFRTWTGRLLFGAALGALIVLGWIRREAHIAETPRVSPGVIPSGVNPDTPVGANEVEESRTGVPSSNGVRSLVPTSVGTRDDELRQPLIPRPSSLVTLPVPFVSQAPFRVWDLPYKEFCEEASVLTIHYWKQGVRPPAADQIDLDLKDIQAWEEANLRTWDDTTAEETARVLREKFGHPSARVVRDVTIEQITAELDAGHPVIVPAAGRELSSPYYKPPGPLYHMLVIIGYDEATREFITNDVGTNTKGAGFRFTYDDLYGAMGDWSVERGAPDTVQKAMIVVP